MMLEAPRSGPIPSTFILALLLLLLLLLFVCEFAEDSYST